MRRTVERPTQPTMAMPIGPITHEKLVLERPKWGVSGLSSPDRLIFLHAVVPVISGSCRCRGVEASKVRGS